MRLRPGAVAALALAALSGCSVLGTGGPPGASPSAPPPPSYPVRSAAGMLTPTPRTAAPPLATTSGSWLKILTSLSAYGQWLVGNPDPALVGNVATPGCAMNDLLTRQLLGLLEENAYVRTSPAVISSVAGPSPAPAGGQVTLEVVAARPAEPVLSRASGAPTISTFTAFPATALQVVLDRGTDRKWRFCTVEASADSGAPDDPSVPLI